VPVSNPGGGFPAPQGAYASIPSASAQGAGAIYYATDLGIEFRSDGTTWRAVGGGLSNAWDMLSRQSYFPSAPAVEYARLASWPTPDATLLQGAGTIDQNDSRLEIKHNVTSGYMGAAWDLSGAQTEVLVVLPQVDQGLIANIGVFVSPAPANGAFSSGTGTLSTHDAYINFITTGGISIYKTVATAYTSLGADGRTRILSTGYDQFGMAFHVVSAGGTTDLTVWRGINGCWRRAGQVLADATFTSFLSWGVFAGTAASQSTYFGLPALILRGA